MDPDIPWLNIGFFAAVVAPDSWLIVGARVLNTAAVELWPEDGVVVVTLKKRGKKLLQIF